MKNLKIYETHCNDCNEEYYGLARRANKTCYEEHVINRLWDAYDGLKIIKGDNLMNNYRNPFPFSYLYNL